MDTLHWMTMGVALASCAGATAGASRWWYGRRMGALRRNIDRLEKARQVSAQHATQLRRQIEQLQKEIVAQQKARAEARMARKRELHETLDASERTIVLAQPGAGAAGRPAHGFADTQPLA